MTCDALRACSLRSARLEGRGGFRREEVPYTTYNITRVCGSFIMHSQVRRWVPRGERLDLTQTDDASLFKAGLDGRER